MKEYFVVEGIITIIYHLRPWNCYKFSLSIILPTIHNIILHSWLRLWLRHTSISQERKSVDTKPLKKYKKPLRTVQILKKGGKKSKKQKNLRIWNNCTVKCAACGPTPPTPCILIYMYNPHSPKIFAQPSLIIPSHQKKLHLLRTLTLLLFVLTK